MKTIACVLLAASFCISTTFAKVDSICKEWFLKGKIPLTETCELKCASLPVDMGTFACGSSCKELCDLARKDKDKETPKIYYPYLTSAEYKLLLANPQNAFVVYIQKEVALDSVVRILGRTNPNDESDALRHFVWAGLLSKELGPDLAKEFLDAHESGESTASPERAMDLANNRAGLAAAERLRKIGSLNLDNLEKAAVSELKSGSLVILNPKGDFK